MHIVWLMAGNQPPVDVLFVAFNGEDMGQLGSKAFLEKPLPYEHVNAVNIDVVGAAENNGIILLGDKSLGQDVMHCWNKGGWPTSYLEEEAASDHVVLNQNGIPAVTVSSNIGFNAIAEKTHYPTDDINGLNYTYIEAVANAVTEYIFSLDSVQILSPTLKETLISSTELEERCDVAKKAILELQPSYDEIVIIESNAKIYVVRNVTHFASAKALRSFMPEVYIPDALGDYKLVEDAPLKWSRLCNNVRK